MMQLQKDRLPQPSCGGIPLTILPEAGKSSAANEALTYLGVAVCCFKSCSQKQNHNAAAGL